MNLFFAWKPYLSFGQKYILKKNEVIYRQGEIGDGFYYLEQGEIKIDLLSEQGGQRILDYVFPGELFGEQGINMEPYFSTATVTVPSYIFYFSNHAFEQIRSEHPEAGEIIINSVVSKIRLLAETVSYINSPMEQQLAHFLHKLHTKYGSNVISIDQTSLARYIGTSRITVYKILQQWKKDGILTISNNKLHLMDLDKIKRILESPKSK